MASPGRLSTWVWISVVEKRRDGGFWGIDFRYQRTTGNDARLFSGRFASPKQRQSGSTAREQRSKTAGVPTIFKQEGYRFFFYSNEHEPIHVHVRRGDGEAVFAITNEVLLRESVGLKVAELARAQELAEENRQLIIQRWDEYFG